MTNANTRNNLLLDTALLLFVRFGYDKTTISDIAQAANVGKGTVYLHFKSKMKLFESLLLRELHLYSESWYTAIMSDPMGGTLGGMYKASLEGLSKNPFIASIMTKDRIMFGKYIREPGNLFESLAEGQKTRHEFITMMQNAGAMRKDIAPKVVAHIMNILSYGMLSMDGVIPQDDIPNNDDLIHGIAQIMDRALTPPAEKGRDNFAASDAGKAVLQPVFEAGRKHFAKIIQEH